MEYIRVIPSKDVGKITQVLIDGERNGTIGKTLKIESGVYDISIDVTTAKELLIAVEDGSTGIDYPKEITIDV